MRHLVSVFLFATVFIALSQVEAQSAGWSRTYDAGGWEDARLINESSPRVLALPGGRFALPLARSTVPGVIEFDSQGVLRDHISVGPFSNWIVYVYGVALTHDNGRLYYGETQVDPPQAGYVAGWLLRVDSKRTVLWQKALTFGLDLSNAEISFVEEQADRTLLVVGSFDTVGNDGWFISKWSEFGELLQVMRYGFGAQAGRIADVVLTADGGIAILGFSAGGTDRTLVGKFDSELSVEWTKSYGLASGLPFPTSFDHTADGGFVVVGRNDYVLDQGWMVKLDSSGSVDWAKLLSPSSSATPPISDLVDVMQTPDGGYVAGGFDGNNAILVKTDSIGQIAWQKQYSPGPSNEVSLIWPAGDGGYFTAGRISDVNWTYSDLWLMNVDANGELTLSCDPSSDASASLVNIETSEATVTPNSPPGGELFDTYATLNSYQVWPTTQCENTESLCDGMDNDGDGATDEACDRDGDGFCDSAMEVRPDRGVTCPNGDTDCDDLNPLIHAGAPDPVDGVNNDCDLFFDEDVTLRGRVLIGSANGRALKNATIDLYRCPDSSCELVPHASATTSDLGDYSVTVPSGVYLIRVSKEYYDAGPVGHESPDPEPQRTRIVRKTFGKTSLLYDLSIDLYLPRPIVFVNGWRRGSCTVSMTGCGGTGWCDRQYGTWSIAYDYYRNEGYIPFVATTLTPCGIDEDGNDITNPHIDNAERLAHYFDHVEAKFDEITTPTEQTFGNARFNMLSHSMGGITSRVFLKDYPRWAQRIDNLVMLGTPNAGSRSATKIINGRAWDLLSLPRMAVTNERYGNEGDVGGVSVYYVSGDGGGPIVGSSNPRPRDGVVPRRSVFDETFSSSELSTDANTRFVSEVENSLSGRGRLHRIQAEEYLCTTDDHGQLHDNNLTLGAVQGVLERNPYSYQGYVSACAGTAAAQALGHGAQQASELAELRIENGIAVAGGHYEHSHLVDNGTTASFELAWESGNVTLRLRDPSGRIIDSLDGITDESSPKLVESRHGS